MTQFTDADWQALDEACQPAPGATIIDTARVRPLLNAWREQREEIERLNQPSDDDLYRARFVGSATGTLRRVAGYVPDKEDGHDVGTAIDALANERDRLAAQVKELHDHHTVLYAKLCAENAAIKNEAQRLAAYTDERLTASAAQVTDANSCAKSLADDLQRVERQVKALTDAAGVLTLQLEAYRKGNADLRAEVERLRESMKLGVVQRLMDERDNLAAQVADLQDQIYGYQMSLTDGGGRHSSAWHVYQALKEKVKALEAERDTLKADYECTEESLAKARETINATSEDICNDIIHLQEDRDTWKTRAEKAEADAAALREYVGYLFAYPTGPKLMPDATGEERELFTVYMKADAGTALLARLAAAEEACIMLTVAKNLSRGSQETTADFDKALAAWRAAKGDGDG